MSFILGRHTKQPDEVLDYDVSFVDWFSNRGDAADSITVTADTGIVVDGSSITANVVRVTLSGGTSGVTYKITVRLTTDAALPVVKEVDFLVKVKAV